MLKIFNKKKVLVPEKPNQNDLIRKIHADFATASEILAEKQTLSKSQRLKKLGYIHSLEVDVNLPDESENVFEMLGYFFIKYPNHKFITAQSVYLLCTKYGLVLSTIDRYTGEVPEKNLREIEKFKVRKEDECFKLETNFRGKGNVTEYINSVKYLDLSEKIADAGYRLKISIEHNCSEKTERCPLEIVAPEKDLLTLKTEAAEIELDDPIVLQPVLFKGEKHYIIITAWGDEANDEIVQTQKFN